MGQKLLYKTLALLLAIGVVMSGFMTFRYGAFYRGAGAVTCSEITQSTIYCDPARYRDQFLIWGIVLVLLIVASVFFTRKQLKTRAKK